VPPRASKHGGQLASASPAMGEGGLKNLGWLAVCGVIQQQRDKRGERRKTTDYWRREDMRMRLRQLEAEMGEICDAER
jgi:hypothetical protein